MYIDVLLQDTNMISFDEFVDFDYKINSSDNNEILIGNCSAASLNFSIWNKDKQYNTFKFKNATCYLYKDVERTQKMGVFQVDKITKDKNTLKFECTDSMTKLDELFKGIQTPFTIFSLIVQICTQLDLTLRNTEEELINGNLTYTSTENLLGKSCRDVLKYCCELTGTYAIFDENGQLFLNWYNLNTIKKEIQYNQLKTFSRDEEELQITGLSVVLEDEEVLIGSSQGYDLRLTKDNPLLKKLGKDERTGTLTNIFNKVNGMKYLSCDISLSVDDEICIGDTLKIFDEDNEEYKIIVSYLNISKIFSMNITSAGENINRDNQSNSSSGQDTNSQQKVYTSKDENWKDITVEDTYAETHLNGISVFGVNEKSSVILNYSICFTIDSETNIKFKLLINDIESKIINYKTKIGFNTFSWSEQANLNMSTSTNIFKFILDTTDVVGGFLFNIEQNNSVLTIIAVGCETDSGGRATNIELRESIKGFNIVGFNFKDIKFKNILDTVNIVDILPINNEISEQFIDLEFNRRKTNIDLDNINISIETNI